MPERLQLLGRPLHAAGAAGAGVLLGGRVRERFVLRVKRRLHHIDLRGTVTEGAAENASQEA